MQQYALEFSYLVEPVDYQMFPKVMPAYKETYCNLGLWSTAHISDQKASK